MTMRHGMKLMFLGVFMGIIVNETFILYHTLYDKIEYNYYRQYA